MSGDGTLFPEVGPEGEERLSDPDWLLDEIRRLCAADQGRLSKLVTLLDAHMCEGGFPPDDWHYPGESGGEGRTVENLRLPSYPPDR
jgi:hypothetical protein